MRRDFRYNDPANSAQSTELFHNEIEREWLTTEEAAYLLSISANALRIMVHRNQIRVFRFGRRLRFKADDCRALVLEKGV